MKQTSPSRIETPGAAPKPWVTIPPELVIEIFRFLDIPSIASAGLTCKKWFACSIDNDLWVQPLQTLKAEEPNATIDYALEQNDSLRDFYVSFRKQKKFYDRVKRIRNNHDYHYITAKHLRYYCAEGIFLPLVASLVLLILLGAWSGIFFGGLYPQIVMNSYFAPTNCTVAAKYVSNESSYAGSCLIPNIVFAYTVVNTTMQVTKSGDCYYHGEDVISILDSFPLNSSYTCYVDKRNVSNMELSLTYSTFFVILVAIFTFMLITGIIFFILACAVSCTTCRAELLAVPCLIKDKIQLSMLSCMGLDVKNKETV
jgi:hypothetical protein